MRTILLPISVSLVLGFALSACHRPLSHPENSDPIYADLNKDAEKTFTELTNLEKDIAAAKTAFEQAPIRTGMRSDARDDYFALLAKKQSLIEKYRFLAVRAQNQRKHDKKEYDEALKSKKPWPNPEDYTAYLTEKRLQTAPREWNPDAKIKKREIASEKTHENGEKGHSEGSEHH